MSGDETALIATLLAAARGRILDAADAITAERGERPTTDDAAAVVAASWAGRACGRICPQAPSPC